MTTSPAPTGQAYCCDMMHDNATHKCDLHPNIFECPDNLIYHSKRNGRYGVIVHDGGESWAEIESCPWCGTNLKVNNAPRREGDAIG